MQDLYEDGQPLVRVWIAEYQDWDPTDWTDMPRKAMAVQAASSTCVSVPDAAMFVEAFNREMLRRRTPFWAIAVPITIRFEQDLTPGESTIGRGIQLQ